MRLAVALLAMLVTGTAQAASRKPDYVRESQCRVLRMFIVNVLCGERTEVARTKTAAQPKASKPAATASPATAAPSVAPASPSPPQAPAQPTQASITSSIPANTYATHRIVPPPVPPGFSGGNSSGKPTASTGAIGNGNPAQGNPQAKNGSVGNSPNQQANANGQQAQQSQNAQGQGGEQGNDKGTMVNIPAKLSEEGI